MPSIALPQAGSQSDTGVDGLGLPADGSAAGDQPAQVAAPSRSRGTAQVRKGSIAEVISVSGAVAGRDETEVSFASSGRVDSVAVKVGQSVEQGQLLAQLDSKQLERDLKSARSRLETANVRIEQAQAQAQSRQADATRSAQLEAAHKQATIADAEAALRSAQDNLAHVMAGPSVADQRAVADSVAALQLALQRAQADLAHASRATDPAEINAAQAAVDQAQSTVDKAQAQLDDLTKGPDPAQITAAQRNVDRAQNALNALLGTKTTENERAIHDAAVADARIKLQEAQDALNGVQNPAPPNQRDVDIARRNVQVAQLGLDSARTHLDALKKGPDPQTIDTATAAVDTAQTNLDSALARQDDLTSHPTAAELRDARDRVNAAQAALNRARSEPSANQSDTSSPFDIALLQKEADMDRAEVDSITQQLDATQLLAPTAGVVTTIEVRAGDIIDSQRGAMILAATGAPLVQVSIPAAQEARVTVGETAVVQVGGDKGPQLSANVSAVKASSDGIGKVALLDVTWPQTVPSFGSSAQVSITVARKDNVLLVPKKAVRSTGAKRYVEYVEGTGTTRKIANVEVGISNADDVQILSGLTEGQTVLLGP